MLPKERRDSGQNDLFKSHLDQIVDMNHALAKLGRKDRLGISRGQIRGGLRRCSRPAAPTDAADGRVGEPQAHV
jgi:hypothetical protein